MNNYQLPYTFVAGTKAIAAEMNENFEYLAKTIKDTSNSLNEKIEKVSDSIPNNATGNFCFNSGPVDSEGNACVLQKTDISEGDIVTKKILTLKSVALYTDGFGVSNTIGFDMKLDYTNYDAGVYSIRVKNNNGTIEFFSVKDAKVYRAKHAPLEPIAGDLWQNISVEPSGVYKYQAGDWRPSNEVEAGVLTISAEGEATVQTNAYNITTSKIMLEELAKKSVDKDLFEKKLTILENKIYPDYKNGVAMAWNTEHTAETNGWIYIHTRQANARVSGTLTVDGVLVFEAYCHSDTQIRVGTVIPIAKGSKYSAAGGYSEQQLLFIPQVQPNEEQNSESQQV